MKKRAAWQQATERLGRAGKADGRFEAELLLRSALVEDRARFFTTLDDEVDEALLAKYWLWLEERASGKPLQHIVGRQEFMGLEFMVTPDVLIPRPDTEMAVEAALLLLRGRERPQVVDIATGSGAIAVALAYHCPQAQVWATDISTAALAIAKQNALLNGVSERLTFVESSWGEKLLAQGLQFDCVVSNPPYIPSGDIPRLAIEVQQEPHLALDGGPDGLDCYRALVPEAKALLRSGGHIVLEVGQGQATAVGALLKHRGFGDITIRPDLAGIDRVVCGCWD